MRRNNDLLPWYFQNLVIRGFDEEDKGDSDTGDADDTDSNDSGDENEDEGKGSEDKGNDGLKSALQKERSERRKLEKENRALKKAQDEAASKDKSETDKAKDEAAKASTKAEKLAKRLRDTAVDNEIIKLGNKLKFRDIDDALKLIDRESIDIEQDDEDPSDLEIDSKSVEDALKALAKAKPHLLMAEGSSGRTGGKFGGGNKSQDEMDNESLRAKYPALRRSGPTQ